MEGNCTPFQSSCLEDAMYRGSWWVTAHGVEVSQTHLATDLPRKHTRMHNLKKRGALAQHQSRPEASAGERRLQGCFSLQRGPVLRGPGTPQSHTTQNSLPNPCKHRARLQEVALQALFAGVKSSP